MNYLEQHAKSREDQEEHSRTQTVQNKRRPSKSLGIKANGGTVRQGR
jgi:hypothetical protein